MRYALIGNNRQEPSPKLKGLCPCCLKPVVSKCGVYKIWHWAHAREFPCIDVWHEHETKWHRDWKNYFPKEWQECVKSAENGERHIADIFTAHGLVVEFQNSPIKLEEIMARESFYSNMVWVVNASRLTAALSKANKGIKASRDLGDGFYMMRNPDKCFSKSWVSCTYPVIFDFKDYDKPSDSDDFSETLWALLPGRIEEEAVIIQIDRASFCWFISNSAHPFGGPTFGLLEQAKLKLDEYRRKKSDKEVSEWRMYLDQKYHR